MPSKRGRPLFVTTTRIFIKWPKHRLAPELGRFKVPVMPEESDRHFLELMKQGWIAGYPPWFHNFWIEPAKCKTEEEKTRLLNFLRAIEDGKMEEMKRLLPDTDPNLRLAVEENRTESLLEWAVEKARDPEAIRLLLKAEKIIALLEQAGLNESASKSDLPEQVDFGERAKSPELKSALELAKKLTKSAPKPVDLDTGELKGVQAFKIPEEKKALDILEEIRPKLAALGAYAFLSEGLMDYDATCLVLIPEPDYRKAIIAFETPVGQSVDCHDLNEWLPA